MTEEREKKKTSNKSSVKSEGEGGSMAGGGWRTVKSTVVAVLRIFYNSAWTSLMPLS